LKSYDGGSEMHTNNLLRKSPTSSVVAGPPIFIKTIAVPLFDLGGIWVAAGATLALPLLHCEAYDGVKADEAGDADAARVHARVKLERNAMVTVGRRKKLDQKAIDKVMWMLNVARLWLSIISRRPMAPTTMTTRTLQHAKPRDARHRSHVSVV
jgi:hypothetical protein